MRVLSPLTDEVLNGGRIAAGMVLCTFCPLDNQMTRMGLIMPERYLIQEGDKDGENDAYGVVTDRRLINPQTINVLSGSHKGRRAFVYYGAYEIAQWLDDDHAIIPERVIYFLVEPTCMLPGFYLGEEVFSQGERTASGIYLTPHAEKKEGIKIKLTNVCENLQYKVGDTVITVDPYQYTLHFEGKKYVKLTEQNIIGVERDGEYVPTNDTVLIEYNPDPELAERIAENDRRRATIDFINKNGMHYSDAHARGEDPSLQPVPEPNTITATVLAYSHHFPEPTVIDGVEYPGKKSIAERVGAEIGEKLLVLRNYGCVLPNGQWIINSDTILARL